MLSDARRVDRDSRGEVYANWSSPAEVAGRSVGTRILSMSSKTSLTGQRGLGNRAGRLRPQTRNWSELTLASALNSASRRFIGLAGVPTLDRLRRHAIAQKSLLQSAPRADHTVVEFSDLEYDAERKLLSLTERAAL